MGRGFTSRGQDLGSVFSAAVGKIQASKCYVESVPLVLKDKRDWFSQGERCAVQLPLDHALAVGSLFCYLSKTRFIMLLSACYS